MKINFENTKPLILETEKPDKLKKDREGREEDKRKKEKAEANKEKKKKPNPYDHKGKIIDIKA